MQKSALFRGAPGQACCLPSPSRLLRLLAQVSAGTSRAGFVAATPEIWHHLRGADKLILFAPTQRLFRSTWDMPGPQLTL